MWADYFNLDNVVAYQIGGNNRFTKTLCTVRQKTKAYRTLRLGEYATDVM